MQGALSSVARTVHESLYSRGDDFEARSYAARESRQGGSRVKINVRGMVFETYEETLAQYPETLLGSLTKRVEYYNPLQDEYCFDRDKFIFDSILFFYQSNGIIACPEDVPRECFLEEIKFFELHEADKKLKKEIEPTKDEEDKQPAILPDHPIQREIWRLFEYPDSSLWAETLGKFSIIVIILSTITFCAETIPAWSARDVVLCEHKVFNNSILILNNSRVVNGTNRMVCHTEYYGQYWGTVEAVYVSWFTLEYVIRFIASPLKWKFVKSALGLVDLLAIIPYYITLILLTENSTVTAFPVLRIIRLLRVVRVLKLSRYSKGLQVLARTLVVSSSDLPSLLAIMVINIILFSSIVYYTELNIKENDFESIPDAFWWTVITMTSVGYGDKVPKGSLGKLVGAFCTLSGIVILFCFPTPVLLSHFDEMYASSGAFEKTDKKKPKRENSRTRVTPTLEEEGNCVPVANQDGEIGLKDVDNVKVWKA